MTPSRKAVTVLLLLACPLLLRAQQAPTASSEVKLERFDPAVLDKSKDPCEDFYAYSCSKWQAAHPIPGDRASIGTSEPLYLWNQTILRRAMEKNAADPHAAGTAQQTGAYWQSCMDLDGRTAHGKQWLAEALKPVDKLNNKKQLPELLADLHFSYFTSWSADDNQTRSAFFGFGPSQDYADSSLMVAGFDQGGLTLPSRDYYLGGEENQKKIREAYKKHLVRMFTLAGDKPEEAAREAAAVYAIEEALAKAQMNVVDRRDPEKTYHKLSLAQLQAALPDFDVAAYLKRTGAPVPPFYIVSTPEFLPAFDAQIKTRSLDELKSYLRWWVIRSSAARTTPELEQASFDFFGTTMNGMKELQPQWRRCVDSADAMLGEALGQEYVKVAFPPEAKAKAVELMGSIREALKQDISALEWMAPATKQQAEAKLDAMIQKIGYPDTWRDYSSVKIVRDNYLANIVAANRFEGRRQLAKIGKPVDKMEWGMTPPTINAYNDGQNNTINFPAGILQYPFFNPAQDDAANLGAIGMVIGHEIIHGFDDQGRKFDAKGNLRDWWTEADAKAYDERGNCLSAQYTHPVPELGEGVKTDGKLTQGEDTADNGGIHLAMMALENLYRKQGKSLDEPGADGLTARQRFFTAYAFSWCDNLRPEMARRIIATNPHSLPHYRVNIPLSNEPGFAQAFGCKVGQPMRLAKTCRVW